MNIDSLVSRIRAEFIEMPGLRLTMAQAARLWNLEVTVCERAVDELVRASFLRRDQAGFLLRALG